MGENGMTLSELEEVIFEFVGAPASLSREDVLNRFGRVIDD